MTRTAARRFGPILVIVLPLIVAACNAVSLPGQPTAGAPTTGPTTAPGGNPSASLDVSFSNDQALEAMLPNDLCGQPSKKQSYSATAGQIPDASANPYGALFAGLGTGSVAVAEPSSSDCKSGAAAFRLQGANQFLIQAFLAAMASQSGGASSQVNLGGKAVTKVDESGDLTYVYAKGDTMFVVTAAGDDEAATVLSALP
jgi:hypothetical protein